MQEREKKERQEPTKQELINIISRLKRLQAMGINIEGLLERREAELINKTDENLNGEK